MNRLTKLVCLIGSTALLAGCANKETDLPPPPPPPSSSSQGAGSTMPTSPGASGPITPAVIPGSLQDFVQSAGADRVFFGYDSYFLDDEARAVLQKQADWLQRNASIRATVEGHSDERGTREYNLALGARRAEAVKNYLVGAGVPAGRIETISYGKERPVALGSFEESWSQNRRSVTVLNNPVS